jgi:hypothetical protein
MTMPPPADAARRTPRPFLSLIACLLGFGALPAGWAAAHLVTFRDDLLGMWTVLLFAAVTGGLALLGASVACLALRRKEAPRWLSYAALGVSVSILVVFFLMWLRLRFSV